MNGWNDFQYNFAAGAGSCGVCYWLTPGYNSGAENTFTCYNPTTKQRGAACLNQPPPPPPWQTRVRAIERRGLHLRAVLEDGLDGLRRHAEQRRQRRSDAAQELRRQHVRLGDELVPDGRAVRRLQRRRAAPIRNNDKEHLEPIPNALAPPPQGNPALDVYYPRVDRGASRPATRCGDDPTKVTDLDCGNVALFPKCAANGFPPPLPSDSPLRNCMVTVLDHYTTSFNWADTNFAAVWLRQFWFVLSNSAITDVQNGGITFVTGGDYTRSSVIDGVWSVAAKSAFVGHTQPDPSEDPNANPFAADVGPFNPKSGLQCPINDPTLNAVPNHCIEPDSGVDFEVANFATNQRLFSIYDGPSYQDSNAYLDIVPTKLPDLTPARVRRPRATRVPAR